MEDTELQCGASLSAVPASVPDPHSRSFDSEAHCGLLNILLLNPVTGIALKVAAWGKVWLVAVCSGCGVHVADNNFDKLYLFPFQARFQTDPGPFQT